MGAGLSDEPVRGDPRGPAGPPWGPPYSCGWRPTSRRSKHKQDTDPLKLNGPKSGP